MAYDDSLKSITLNADASIGIYTGVPGLPGSASPNSGKQFRFVKVTGDNQAGLATAAANEQVVGVLQNKPQHVGDASTVGIFGVSLVQAGGAVVPGAVKSDANGQAVVATPGTDVVLGIALGSAASGSLVPVLLRVN